ncbi:hypothetical protein RvY_03245 [Ramazzottius varieornatus]|uniref:Nicastrin n=1 Tax=Ramazzottius varieornatus TaxID=947166 RepID=A0A1D1UMC9_RAMVA|nr:hypothetical protein RvY_03245 [Ramazzottius varieornatus]
MMAQWFALIQYVCLLSLTNWISWSEVTAGRIREKIYHDFTGPAYCIKRLNGSHETGCSSGMSGNVGVLHAVEDFVDVNFVCKSGPHAPYVAVIDALDLSLYNTAVLRQLDDSQRVAGVILIKRENGTVPTAFSPEGTSPNRGYGLYSDPAIWNPVGSALLHQKWAFPIFLLHKKEEISYLFDNCLHRFNNRTASGGGAPWPLCSAQLKNFMFAAKDSKSCIRRSEMMTNLNPQGRCDPLSDFNVWSILNSLSKNLTSSAPANSTIVIAARLDSNAIFYQLANGAESTVSGLVTLLLLAEALAQVREELANKQILFLLLNGESYDYIGSSRLVYDMTTSSFPRPILHTVLAQNALINLDSIDMFIELSQVALLRDNAFYLHHHKTAARNDSDPSRQREGAFAAIAAEEGRRYQMDVTTSTASQQLPPSSLQSFLKAKPNMAGVVVADHSTTYHNQYYNSLFDTLESHNSSFGADSASQYSSAFSRNVQKVATVIVRSLYRLVTGKSSDIEASLQSSNDLMYCYAHKSNCSLFQTYFTDLKAQEHFLSDGPMNTYISVNRGSVPQEAAYLSWKTLAKLTGNVVGQMSEDECAKKNLEQDELVNYIFVNGNATENGTQLGDCIESNTGISQAKSPAFLLNDYSGKYSTWTESQWSSATFRIFLQPDPQEDVKILVFGIINTVVLTLLMYGLSHRATDIFLIPNNPVS